MALPKPPLEPAETPLARLPEEWEQWAQAHGQPAYRGRQIFAWLHQRGVCNPDQMHNVPAVLRQRLHEEGCAAPVTFVDCVPAADGTRKLLAQMRDGERVETVLLPQLDDPERELDDGPSTVTVTQCISSQVGCAMGCVFCASGLMGLKRQLTAGEIVGQVLQGRALLEPDERLRNVVFMGMGEPLHNYAELKRALVLMTHEQGLGLSARRVTVSTSGLVDRIDALGQDFHGKVQLAVSLHAVDDETRSAIMPVNRKHNLAELIACLRRYPLPRRRRITIEYTLIEGQNDSLAQADALVKLLADVPVKINLIPMNPIGEAALVRVGRASTLHAPDKQGVLAFQARLRERGMSAFIRKTRGDDVAAACGQLVFHGESRRTRTQG